MTVYDFIAVAALILAIGINTLSVYLQKTHKIYEQFGDNALRFHSILISFFWALFIVTEFVTNNSTWRLSQAYPFLGIILMSVALAIFTAAIRQIGRHALVNANFFGHPQNTLRGVYKCLDNPIYWSYIIWFAGLGFLTSLKAFFLFAVISIIGLIFIESRVERK